MPKRRKLVRFVLLLLGAVVLIVVALSAAVGLFGSRAARAVLESTGAKTFGTPVTIENTSISVLGGSLHLQNLTVDNPHGYQHKTFLELRRGEMHVKMAGLLGHELTIRDLKLDGLHVILEPGGTGSNLHDIIDSLHRAPPFGKRLYVDRLEITNITVTMALVPAAGRVGMVPIKLSPITMTGLGRDEWLDASKLAHKILSALAAGVAAPNGEPLPNQVVGGVLNSVVDLGKALLSTARDPNDSR
jgi:hypothetical protein